MQYYLLHSFTPFMEIREKEAIMARILYHNKTSVRGKNTASFPKSVDTHALPAETNQWVPGESMDTMLARKTEQTSGAKKNYIVH